MRLQKALPRKKVVERVWFSKDVKEDILRKSDGVCAHCGCPVAIGDSTVARLVLNTWTCLSTQVSDHLITTFSLHRFYKPGSDDSKQSLVTPSELLNVIKRMQIIGEEVL